MFPEFSKGSAFESLGNSTLQHPEEQYILKHRCENLYFRKIILNLSDFLM